MALPSAVEAQGRRADELQQARLAARNGNTEQPAPTQATATPTPASTTQEAQQETAAPAATATPTPTQATPPAQPDPGLAQRLRVLEGKYNAEVPRLSAQAKAEKERADKAEQELAELRKKQAAQPLVTPEEVKEFGEPLVELARKIAREENRTTTDENGKLRAEIAELRAQVNSTAQVGQSLNTQAFYAALDAKHSDWRALNDDAGFLKWLEEVDPLYGKPRQDVLDEAQNSLDANRVAAFFTSYKALVQSRAAPRTEALESQVTPSTKTTGAPPSTDPTKKIWTAAMIAKFYDDVRRGNIKAEDAARIELDIQAAAREGRYRQR
jgi:hypothetical protein